MDGECVDEFIAEEDAIFSNVSRLSMVVEVLVMVSESGLLDFCNGWEVLDDVIVCYGVEFGEARFQGV